MSTNTDLVNRFQDLIKSLNTIIFGDGDVELDGVVKPTWTKWLQSKLASGGKFGFVTLADFEAKKASLPADSIVTIGEAGSNQGDNIWDGNVLTKSPYDPLVDANEYADQVSSAAINRVATQTSTDVLLAFSDLNGSIYCYFDSDGSMYVVGLAESVQTEFEKLHIKTNNLAVDQSEDLYRWRDFDGNVVAVMDRNGGLALTGLEKTVQEYLLNANVDGLAPTAPKSYRTKADAYSAETASLLSQNTVNAPIGRGLLPQQYHIGDKWIDSVKLPLSSSRIIIGAYNDKGNKTNWVPDSGMVHPNVIEFDEPLCGFKYWMGINPYTNTSEDYELPYIYGSNSPNLDGWTLIPDFPQPFDIDPPNTDGVLSGHLSDSCFTYDPVEGKLWFFWRQTRYYTADRNRNNATNTFVGRWTKDGSVWSERVIILPTHTVGNDLKLSPSILYNPKDGLFYMHYINLNGSMSCEVTESLEHPNWRKIHDIALPFTAWHLEMKWVGDAVVALVHSDTVDELYIGISYDIAEWKWGPSIFESATKLYKSSFLARFNDAGQISLKVMYTTDQNTTPKWQLHTSQTNFIDI